MDYLEQKQLLLNSILLNTKSQTDAIENDDIDTLELLIAKRQEMMLEVDKLDASMADQVAEITSSQAQKLKETLKEIITIDNNNKSLMKRELSDIKGELLKIRMGRQREEHYGTEYGTYKEEGIFFDTKE